MITSLGRPYSPRQSVPSNRAACWAPAECPMTQMLPGLDDAPRKVEQDFEQAIYKLIQ